MIFKEWPKTPRLFRPIVITEKIDGTNAAVIVTEDGQVGAQSRKRLITPQDDNYGFAAWVQDNAEALAELLGPGHHYGEWWGSGIQRGYGLTNGERRFSLFNVNRYGDLDFSSVPQMNVVPTLWSLTTFDTDFVRAALLDLQENGSMAQPGFMRPEGVIVFMSSSGNVYKSLIENDSQPKGSK